MGSAAARARREQRFAAGSPSDAALPLHLVLHHLLVWSTGQPFRTARSSDRLLLHFSHRQPRQRRFPPRAAVHAPSGPLRHCPQNARRSSRVCRLHCVRAQPLMRAARHSAVDLVTAAAAALCCGHQSRWIVRVDASLASRYLRSPAPRCGRQSPCACAERPRGWIRSSSLLWPGLRRRMRCDASETAQFGTAADGVQHGRSCCCLSGATRQA